MMLNIRTKTKTGFEYSCIDDNRLSYTKINLPKKPSLKNYIITDSDIDHIETINNTFFETSNEEKMPLKVSKQPSISNYDLAQILLEENTFLKIDGTLYHWNHQKGYYIGMSNEYSEMFVRQNIPLKFRGKVNSNSIREIIQWIKSSNDLEAKAELILKKNHLIAFNNCILDSSLMKTMVHNPNYYFTSKINANYSIEAKYSGKYFEKFMQNVTLQNEDLYYRIQELFGYVISEIRSVKCIPFFLGPKDTGKSILLRILEYLVGSDSVTNLSFDQLNKPDYLVKLLGKRLNTCGETSEISLNRLDILKKLSGGDTITVRGIFEQPINFINSAALLFAGNHLPKIKGADSHNAFSERLVIIPITNIIQKEKQDIHLFEKLVKEIDYIAKWAVEGFIRWKANNFKFTTCNEVLDIENQYLYKIDSINSFIETCCKFDFKSKIHNNELIKAYHLYCEHLDLAPKSDKQFHSFLKNINGLNYSRFRLHNENKYGYMGITLKEEGEMSNEY